MLALSPEHATAVGLELWHELEDEWKTPAAHTGGDGLAAARDVDAALGAA